MCLIPAKQCTPWQFRTQHGPANAVRWVQDNYDARFAVLDKDLFFHDNVWGCVVDKNTRTENTTFTKLHQLVRAFAAGAGSVGAVRRASGHDADRQRRRVRGQLRADQHLLWRVEFPINDRKPRLQGESQYVVSARFWSLFLWTILGTKQKQQQQFRIDTHSPGREASVWCSHSRVVKFKFKRQDSCFLSFSSDSSPLTWVALSGCGLAPPSSRASSTSSISWTYSFCGALKLHEGSSATRSQWSAATQVKKRKIKQDSKWLSNFNARSLFCPTMSTIVQARAFRRLDSSRFVFGAARCYFPGAGFWRPLALRLLLWGIFCSVAFLYFQMCVLHHYFWKIKSTGHSVVFARMDGSKTDVEFLRICLRQSGHALVSLPWAAGYSTRVSTRTAGDSSTSCGAST